MGNPDMNALTFTLKTPLARDVDLSPLTPSRLAGLKVPEIAALTLHSGREQVQVASLFQIEGNDPSQIIIKQSSRQLHHIGQEMESGQIVVEGDAGDFLGNGMQDGSIRVIGNAGDYAANGMQGGRVTVTGNIGAFAGSGMHNGILHVHGDASDFTAAALPGAMDGLNGGTVLINGNTGDRLADRMRRGLVYVKGNAGAYCASRMRAGTVIVLGTCQGAPGQLMQRGTLVLAATPQLPPTFNDCGIHHLHFLTLLQRWLAAMDSSLPFMSTTRVHRYAGDLAASGKGEILVPASETA
jgi:formylmethanofuran dehydrogenase subunit C